MAGANGLPALHLASSGWAQRGIHTIDLDNAASWVRNTTLNHAAGGWRAKIINGSIFVNILLMRSHWTERSSMLQILLHASKQPLPDVDIVFYAADQDFSPRVQRHARGTRAAPPLFVHARTNGRSSLPLPDFTWVGWHTHTPPWCELLPTLAAAGARQPWRARHDLAYFSGGLRAGSHRLELQVLNARAGGRLGLLLRDVRPTFATLGEDWRHNQSLNHRGASTQTALGADHEHEQYLGAGDSTVDHGRRANQTEACGYRYTLSLPGYGYSSRLKGYSSTAQNPSSKPPRPLLLIVPYSYTPSSGLV